MYVRGKKHLKTFRKKWNLKEVDTIESWLLMKWIAFQTVYIDDRKLTYSHEIEKKKKKNNSLKKSTILTEKS